MEKTNASITLLQQVIANKGNWDNTYKNLAEKKFAKSENFNPNEWGNFITLLDSDYPSVLKKQCYKTPFVLFYEGNIDLLKSENKKIALLHSENKNKAIASDYDSLLLPNNDLIYILTGESVVDEHIINTYPNKLIVVLGYSLDHYSNALKQKIISKGGLIITEQPYNSFNNLNNDMFAMSYRIISALCDKVFSLYISKRSLLNSAIMFALQNGKDIFVCPASFKDTDCENNHLIAQGATPVYDSDTFKFELDTEL